MAAIIIPSCEQLSINGTSAQSAVLPHCSEVLLFASVDCYVRIGTDPTATATGTANAFIAAGYYVPVKVPARATTDAHMHLAAITGGASGTLQIMPVG